MAPYSQIFSRELPVEEYVNGFATLSQLKPTENQPLCHPTDGWNKTFYNTNATNALLAKHSISVYDELPRNPLKYCKTCMCGAGYSDMFHKITHDKVADFPKSGHIYSYRWSSQLWNFFFANATEEI